ncbi:DinB family protein [Edaphobacter sp. HDX4]|uniref:DinB family protein n=1 Tax=Edaphobacter sp. HDX4 TaxID=2794064 RepID=UPI002FE5DAB7
MVEMVEPWLRGTRTEIDAVRRAVLHALELAAEDIARWSEPLNGDELESRPLGLPSVGFQVRHIARSLDRLLTYAENQKLTARQLKLLETEDEIVDRESTLMEFAEAIEVSTKRVLAFSEKSYEQARTVGRKNLPTTVGGLLVHCADHTQRHVGQAITTAKAVLALRGS